MYMTYYRDLYKYLELLTRLGNWDYQLLVKSEETIKESTLLRENSSIDLENLIV
jgi:hypothetical protein